MASAPSVLIPLPRPLAFLGSKAWSKAQTTGITFPPHTKTRQFTMGQGTRGSLNPSSSPLLLLPSVVLLSLQQTRKSYSKVSIAAEERKGARLHIHIS